MSLTLYVLTDRRGGWRVEVEGRPISDASLGLRSAEDEALRYLLAADEEGDILVRDAYERVRSHRHVAPHLS